MPNFSTGGGGHAAGPLDLDTREHIEEDTFGKYRYQLDLGGGGGTTWSGVIPKLAMPGVLFHHVTSMKDSYFDLLKPYEHYYPLKEDFSNFEELVQEVRDDPEKAKRISAAATAWVKEFRKVGSLLKHNYDTLAGAASALSRSDASARADCVSRRASEPLNETEC